MSMLMALKKFVTRYRTEDHQLAQETWSRLADGATILDHAIRSWGEGGGGGGYECSRVGDGIIFKDFGRENGGAGGSGGV